MLKPLSGIAGIGTTICLSVSGALAEEDCNKLETYAAWKECVSEEYDKADTELNVDYSKLVDKLHGQDLELLKEAQGAWTKFRDAECAFKRLGSIGGSVNSTVFANCMTGVTEQRIKDLNYYLTCEEGDLSCPTWSSK